MSLYFSLRETLHCILLPLTAWSHHAAVYSSDLCFFPTDFMSIAPCICFLSANSGTRSNLILIYCRVFFSSLYSNHLFSFHLLSSLVILLSISASRTLVCWCGPSRNGHRSPIRYSIGQYLTVQYMTVQYRTWQCSTVQYMTVQYSIAQYSAIWSTHTTSKLSYNYSDTGWQ